MTAKPPPTHMALAYRREGRRFGRWLEVGMARTETDGAIRVFLDRLPIGGFTGYLHLSPIGASPPPEPAPPDEDSEPAA
jgi:hypothetical protein